MIRHRRLVVLCVIFLVAGSVGYLAVKRGELGSLRGALSASEEELVRLTAKTELLSRVEPLATDRQPLSEVLVVFSNAARGAMADLGITGEIGIHSAAAGLSLREYYRTASPGFSTIPVLILIHSYSRYDHVVAFLNAITTRFPAVLEGLEFDGRRMAILVLLTGRTG